MLEHRGTNTRDVNGDALYANASSSAGMTEEDAMLQLVPYYYAWSNREFSSMQVWIPVKSHRCMLPQPTNSQ